MHDSRLQYGIDRLSGRKGGHPNRPSTRKLLGLTVIGDSNMKKIPLTQGKFALVDDEDYVWLMQWKWQASTTRKSRTYYATRMPWSKGKRKTILMHREIMNAPKGMEIDHINHNGIDNQKVNMRICTHKQNAQNKQSYKNTSSKYRGVCWHKTKKRWSANIKTDGMIKSLGRFRSEHDAARAYNREAEKLFASFACLNMIELGDV